MSALGVGDIVAGYRVIELVGAGGVGRVYRAVQPRLNRVVALKVIRPEIAAQDAFRRQFTRDTRMARAVEHPNVLPVFEAGEAVGALFVAMQWAMGPDLRRLMLVEGALKPVRAVEVIAQLAAGLQAAHTLGLVHGNIKPSNVLSDDECVYLCDFGAARALAAPDDVTSSVGFMDGLDYAAPELFDGARAGIAADVYALGCVLFEMLTGLVPFPGNSLVAKARAHSQHKPAAVSALRPGSPKALDEVIYCALAKDPASRFTTPSELAGQARRALDRRPRSRRADRPAHSADRTPDGTASPPT